MKTETC